MQLKPLCGFQQIYLKKTNSIFTREKNLFLSVKRPKMPDLPSTCPLRTITKVIKEVQPSV